MELGLYRGLIVLINLFIWVQECTPTCEKYRVDCGLLNITTITIWEKTELQPGIIYYLVRPNQSSHINDIWMNILFYVRPIIKLYSMDCKLLQTLIIFDLLHWNRQKFSEISRLLYLRPICMITNTWCLIYISFQYKLEKIIFIIIFYNRSWWIIIL